MLRRIIIFLIRHKLGVKKYQQFRFEGQKSKTDYYFFTADAVWKHTGFIDKESNVRLNYLIGDDCKIKIIK